MWECTSFFYLLYSPQCCFHFCFFSFCCMMTVADTRMYGQVTEESLQSGQVQKCHVLCYPDAHRHIIFTRLLIMGSNKIARLYIYCALDCKLLENIEKSISFSCKYGFSELKVIVFCLPLRIEDILTSFFPGRTAHLPSSERSSV